MLKTNKILHKHIPKRILKIRSRCRRKLYRLTELVERILLSTQDKKYQHKQERLKIKKNVQMVLLLPVQETMHRALHSVQN